MNKLILPEGRSLETQENQRLCQNIQGLEEAFSQNLILEGIALHCETGIGITVALGAFVGFVPWDEGALGLAQGLVREIAVMSRIGRPISVVITAFEEENDTIKPILSRAKAQSMAKDQILSLPDGAILPATVTRLETFGAFVDIGCGVASLISIDRISISRIAHPSQRFTVGQEIFVAILDHDWVEDRVRVTHRELLGTWEENARKFSVGMTLPAVVRSIKSYGIFVELSPNFSGLAEFVENLSEGQRVSVYIKGLLHQRMKCKLLIIGTLPPDDLPALDYYLPENGRLSTWTYPPEGCVKAGGETLFL